MVGVSIDSIEQAMFQARHLRIHITYWSPVRLSTSFALTADPPGEERPHVGLEHVHFAAPNGKGPDSSGPLYMTVLELP